MQNQKPTTESASIASKELCVLLFFIDCHISSCMSLLCEVGHRLACLDEPET